MKKLYILFFLTIGLLSNAQIINFPDANFKTKLLLPNQYGESVYYDPMTGNFSNIMAILARDSNNNPILVDQNGDGEIQVSEALNVYYLNVSINAGLPPEYGYTNVTISNLSGIEYFTNLRSLECQVNQITILPLNTLSNLRFLNCSSNILTNLNISNNINLETLISDVNQLSSLNVTQNLLLKSLICQNNQLTNLDITLNSLLSELKVSHNNLAGIDVSQNQVLRILHIDNNNINSIDVTQNPTLEQFLCGYNQFSSINVSQNFNLHSFDFEYNQLTNIDLSNNDVLQSFSCKGNQITSLDLSDKAVLNYLDCGFNLLTNLDLSQNINLDYLRCNNNPIVVLNLKNGDSTMSLLEFSNIPSLQYICADENELTIVQNLITQYGYTNCHVNSYCSFTPGGTFYEISGNTKLDSNNNGCDVSDINYPNLNFLITDGTNTGSLIANQTGNYYIPVQAGNHTITPNLENPSYFNISPTSFTANFPTQASPFTQDFCVIANGVKHDVEVVLIPTTPARPGFDTTYKLVYRNKGNQIGNGNVILSFLHTVLDYVSSNPVYNSSSTSTFTWNYTNLQPFETREIEITFNVNSPMDSPPVNIGEPLDFSASIIPTDTDETPVDNNFSLNQIVVGSYDPNDKTCLEGGTIDTSMVGEYVHYVIRFENTGTYLAENIVVKDMIDISKFEVASLVPLHGSHDFYTRIKDNKVEFIFENINLDFDNATNDGYVAFKIKTLPTLTVGDTFSNEASIYFDYNFPIITNEYVTTFQNILLNNHDFSFQNEFVLYPNPSKDVLNIQAKQGLQLNSIEIYNQLGQIVMAVTNAVNTIDVSNLASGTYFVKVNSEKGSANAKFVKE